MQIRKYKLFWATEQDKKFVTAISYDQSGDYYSFLKKCRNDGYRQIIITSPIMLNLLENFVLSRKYDITEIKFMEDDDELTDTIKLLLNNVKIDRAYYKNLFDYLEVISEKSSIELKQVYLKGSSADGVAVNFFAQVNGIIGISEPESSEVLSGIEQILERYLL